MNDAGRKLAVKAYVSKNFDGADRETALADFRRLPAGTREAAYRIDVSFRLINHIFATIAPLSGRIQAPI